MENKKIKKKYVFVGDLNSVNLEIISKSHNNIKNKVDYILIGNKKKIQSYLNKIESNLQINEILDPYIFNTNKKALNIFNIEDISLDNHKNLLNQIKISNYLSNKNKYDLVTMPIDKSVFKQKINFTGMTEYLGKLNKKNTIMLMHGENFSTIPYTTHINQKKVHKYLESNKIDLFLKNLLKSIKSKIHTFKFKKIIFLCHNPHCGENMTIGLEDNNISKLISKYKMLSGPLPADSAFNNVKKDTLFISTYHDQALIPFKILNKKGINLTLGLNFRRISPSHGTAKDKKFKNIADNSSYIECMLI